MLVQTADTKNDLVVVDVLFRCSRSGKACQTMRDQLVKMSGITEAYLTNQKIGNIVYCVGGTAICSKKDFPKLFNRVKNLKSEGINPITIKQLELLIPVQSH